MSDLALRWDAQNGGADLAIEANDLASEDGLRTAILLSLFTDRRADSGDVVPGDPADRRGWWGDAAPVLAGDLIGSRLWLLAREKQRADVLPRLKAYALEALQWLVDDLVAERVEVAASFPGEGIWALTVEVYRPSAPPVEYRFTRVWGA